MDVHCFYNHLLQILDIFYFDYSILTYNYHKKQNHYRNHLYYFDWLFDHNLIYLLPTNMKIHHSNFLLKFGLNHLSRFPPTNLLYYYFLKNPEIYIYPCLIRSNFVDNFNMFFLIKFSLINYLKNYYNSPILIDR
jgi:hypothetical protein